MILLYQDMEDNKKKSKKEREKDLRDDGFKKRSLIDYNAILDKPAEDKRFERERSIREQELSSSSSSAKPSAATSTFDAFKRMAAGLEGRTLADKMADPNRPTWEQYKKDNEDKLDMVGGEAKKMVEYRAELDKERETRLREGGAGKQSHAIEDSDNEEDSDDGSKSEDKDRRHKHSKKKSSKKEKHKKKHKKKDKSEKKSKTKKAKKSKRSSSSSETGGEDLKESKKRKSSSSSSSDSSNSDHNDESSDDGDDDAPRSVITGKKIKMSREMTYEDRLQEIDRAAKRHFMNTQY